MEEKQKQSGDTQAVDKTSLGYFLGEGLKAFRLQNGMTCDQLAEVCGVEERHIRRLESGRHCPSLHTLAPLVAAYDFPLLDILKQHREAALAESCAQERID
ncbi:MAG: helix-turn-helix domain-containing protein [Clostridiales bacterium]|nr:helix-turn-helix domain-containing protein [Clostridiales bacterium]